MWTSVSLSLSLSLPWKSRCLAVALSTFTGAPFTSACIFHCLWPLALNSLSCSTRTHTPHRTVHTVYIYKSSCNRVKAANVTEASRCVHSHPVHVSVSGKLQWNKFHYTINDKTGRVREEKGSHRFTMRYWHASCQWVSECLWICVRGAYFIDATLCLENTKCTTDEWKRRTFSQLMGQSIKAIKQRREWKKEMTTHWSACCCCCCCWCAVLCWCFHSHTDAIGKLLT